jgi:alpha-glucosidase
MPWSGAKNHGFTTGTPWLPAAPEHAGLTVEAQETDTTSTLALSRRLIALRNGSPALRLGDIRFTDSPAPLLAFEREHDGERLLCVFNMSGQPTDLPSDGETLIEQAPTAPYGFRIARL